MKACRPPSHNCGGLEPSKRSSSMDILFDPCPARERLVAGQIHAPVDSHSLVLALMCFVQYIHMPRNSALIHLAIPSWSSISCTRNFFTRSASSCTARSFFTRQSAWARSVCPPQIQIFRGRCSLPESMRSIRNREASVS